MTTEDKRISSQPEAELKERDVIVPWPIAVAVLLFAVFALLEFLLVGRGATGLDSLFYSGPDAADGQQNMMFIALNRDALHVFDSIVTMASISAIVLASAFTSGGASIGLLSGPIMGSLAKRKTFLVQGEVLIGVTLAVWVCSYLLRYALRPGIIDQIVPSPYLVGAAAFWGTLALMAWYCTWHRAWRYVATAAFVGVLGFVLYGQVFVFHVYITTIAASLLLGAAIVCTARWCVHRYA